MATEPISEQELATLEARHRCVTYGKVSPWCPACRGTWPCDALKLIAEVRRLRAEAAPRPHAPDCPLAPPRHQHGLPPA